MNHKIIEQINSSLLNKARILNSRVISNPKFLSSQLYHQICQLTEFLNVKSTVITTAERIYCVYHNIDKIQKCPHCQCDLRFRMFKYGYAKTCNKSVCKRAINTWRSSRNTKINNIKSEIIDFINFYNLRKFVFNPKEVIKRCVIDRINKKQKFGAENQLVNRKHIKNKLNYLFNVLDYTKDIIPINIDNLRWNERFFILINDLTTLPKCKFCNSLTKYINFKIGYQPFCNKRCEQQFIVQNIKTNINNQKFEIIEDFNKLKNNNIAVKCRVCNTTYLKDLNNGRWQNIHCPKCFGNVSKPEKGLVDYLKTNFNITDIIENTRKIIDPYELDIYIPSKNIAIEYNGNYWHSEINGEKNKKYHVNKMRLCQEKNIRLIQIFSDEFIQKPKIVYSRLKHILGKIKYSIYARKCIIKLIDSKLKNKFLNKYHIQGEDKSNVHLGAFYKNRLVAVMTFGKLRKALGQIAKEGSWELTRFATIANFNIVGIGSKLLNYFEQNYKPMQINSYADRRWSEGNMYYKLGFKLDHISSPNYWYLDDAFINRIHRFNFRKNVLKDKLPNFDPNLSEWENMKNNNYDRIWDCGNLVFKK